ncbi:protein tramtrack, alpha isoform-like isoform X2 [Cloeon dipterum]
MSSSQRFCLRWNNHQSNMLSVFEQLLQDESFVDVTLAVEGLYLKAHKMVLSACSPYFQTLFVNNPDKHPIVFLKDVPFADMRSLLDFMYKGEVSVDQERLTAFLKVAESLRIKGLTEVNEESCNLPRITSSLLNSVPGNMADERHERQPSPHHFMGHKRPYSSPSPLQNLQHLHTRHMSPSYGGKRKRVRGVQEPVEKERHGGSGRSSPSSSVSGQHDLTMSGQDCISSSRSPDDSFSKDAGGKRIKDEPEPTAGPSNQDSGQTYGNSQDTDETGSGVNFGAETSDMAKEDIDNSMGEPMVRDSWSLKKEEIGGDLMVTPPTPKQNVRRRARRRTSSAHDPAEQLTEMSVRGLNLFRYASVSEGVYKCIECEKANMVKTFKNKYSFQRHAFLYHEGHQRKVFPCPVCGKEFSRPDKMKNHMKTVHDCFMPKDCLVPIGFYLQP